MKRVKLIPIFITLIAKTTLCMDALCITLSRAGNTKKIQQKMREKFEIIRTLIQDEESPSIDYLEIKDFRNGSVGIPFKKQISKKVQQYELEFKIQNYAFYDLVMKTAPKELKRASRKCKVLNEPIPNIYLTGYTGTGKSEIVKAFPMMLGVPYIYTYFSNFMTDSTNEDVAKLKSLFENVEQLNQKFAVIIEGVDFILEKRNSAVKQVLIDILEKYKSNENIFILGTAYDQDNIFPSLFSTIITHLPSPKERRLILQYYFNTDSANFIFNINKDQMQAITRKTDKFTHYDMQELCSKAKLIAYRKEKHLNNDVNFPVTISQNELIQVLQKDYNQGSLNKIITMGIPATLFLGTIYYVYRLNTSEN